MSLEFTFGCLHCLRKVTAEVEPPDSGARRVRKLICCGARDCGQVHRVWVELPMVEGRGAPQVLELRRDDA